MYRFLLRPRWLAFHVLCLAAVVAMVNLGLWQLSRLDERREFNATVEARFDQPPLPLDELLASGTPDEVEWRPATVSGVYAADGQLLVVNRSQNGRAGDNVVTPLVLDDGRVVLVNRGFVPLGTEAPPPPAGEVTVVGRIRPAEERRRGQLTDAEEGRLTEVQRIDLDRLAPQLPGEPVPAYLDLIESTPPEPEGIPEALPVPDLTEGPHLSYAVQWFIFATCVVVGWVLAVRHSVRQRRRGSPDGAAPVTATPPTADPAATGPAPSTAPSGTPHP